MCIEGGEVHCSSGANSAEKRKKEGGREWILPKEVSVPREDGFRMDKNWIASKQKEKTQDSR